jgi:hypothetical protein
MRFTKARAAAALLALGIWTSGARAATDDPWTPDRPEPGSVEKIREYTTAPEYLPESVSYVPASDTVPSPTQVLGHLVGAPGELSRVTQVHDYFRKLDQASDCVTVRVIGKSEEGREILLATISSPENLRDLTRYSDITRRLADPRSCSHEEMQQLVATGKPVYYFMGGLHSPETGSPEMLMELAYRLAVSEKPEIRAIRDNVIVLITPVVETDGRDRQVEWYYRHTRGKKLDFEELDAFSDPPYWGSYAYHDNNRDGMQLTLALTRAVNSVYWDLHPQVVHDLHESVPLLYISTGHGPYTLAADPVSVNEWQQFAYHEAGALQAQNLPGVWTWAFWDGWWPGYLFSVANNHNSIGRFYETFGNSMAETFDRKLKGSSFAGKPVTDVQWYRPSPPQKKFKWSLRNNTNYMEAGTLAALGYTALHGKELLTDFWVKGHHAVEKGKSEAPYAWVFPTEQRDRARLAYLVRQLLAHHIEVQRLRQELKVGDKSWPAGSYVVRMDQPYRNAAITFLDKQDFPVDEPNPPYDDVAWTWPLLQNVKGERVDKKEVLDAGMNPVTECPTPTGSIDGTGGVFLLRDTGQTALLSARLELGKTSVEAADTAFTVNGANYPAGSWIARGSRQAVEGVASRYGLDFTAVEKAPKVEHHALDLPRLAVLHTWISTQDCGWVRYTLDQGHVPYTLISDDDLRKGGLRGRFDMILFPNSGGSLAAMVHGIDPKYGPLAYTKTAEYPSHGYPDASADITGGMGFGGLANLQVFVRDGGVLVTLANAGTLPVDGGIVRDVQKVPPGTVNTPGSEVQAKVLRPLHPLAYGFEELPGIFRGNGPLFDVADRDRGRVVLQFGTKKVPEDDDTPKGSAPDTSKAGATSGKTAAADTSKAHPKGDAAKKAGDIVLSGMVKPKEKLDGLPAILDVPVGKGRVLLFAFNPMHRYLNHGDFRWVYNAILNWNDMPRQ